MMDRFKLKDIFPDTARKISQRFKIKKDELSLIRKGYLIEKGDISERERTVVARVSTKDRDRDGEIIEPTGIDLKAYEKNPVLMWSHRYSDPPIGKAIWAKRDENGMVAKFQFAKTQMADEVYGLFKDGYLKGFSVGFIPLDFDEKTKIHKKISLIEISAVPVPANENALIMEAYKDGKITTKGLIEDFEIDETDISEEEALKETELESEIEIIDEKNPEIVIPLEELETKEIKFELEEDEEIDAEEKVEVTENYIRIPVSSGHDGHRIRTITISASKGIKALYCGTCKKIKTYLFDKDKWTLAEAQAWIREHKRGLERYEEILSKQEEMPGDIAEKMAEEWDGWADFGTKALNATVWDYMASIELKLENIESGMAEVKEGRVLSTKNRTLVKDIMDKLGELKSKLEELYNATEPPTREEEKEIEIEEPLQIVIEQKEDEIEEDDDVDWKTEKEPKEKDKSKIEIDIKELARNILREKLDKAKGKVG